MADHTSPPPAASASRSFSMRSRLTRFVSGGTRLSRFALAFVLTALLLLAFDALAARRARSCTGEPVLSPLPFRGGVEEA